MPLKDEGPVRLTDEPFHGFDCAGLRYGAECLRRTRLCAVTHACAWAGVPMVRGVLHAWRGGLCTSVRRAQHRGAGWVGLGGSVYVDQPVVAGSESVASLALHGLPA